MIATAKLCECGCGKREDYRELCKRCHSRYDETWAERPRDTAGRWS